MTTIPSSRTVVRSCVAPLLGYAIAVGAALVLMILLVTAIAVSEGGGGDGDPADDLDIQAIGTLVGMPFQVVGMALGGSLQLGDGEFALSLFAPPLLVTAVFVVAVYLLSKRSERAAPTASTTERAILAVSGALATAVVATALTRLLAMRDDDLAMHAATVGLFFGTLVLSGSAALLGRQAASGSLWPRWLPADARRAAHLVSQHLAVALAVLIPVATIWMLVESGLEAALYSLVWAPTIAFGAFSLGHFGALTALGEHQFAWDLGWFAGLALPLIAVLLSVAASVAWHLRRGQDKALLAQPASWASLPVAYGVAALAVCMVSTVGISGAFYGVGGGVTFHAAYWLIPVLALWGGAIEGLSRFVAPALASSLPSSLSQRLSKGPARVVSAPVAPTQRIPMSPTDRARAKKALIGVAVVGGLGLIGIITVSIIGAAAFNPEKQAEAYLDALIDADAEEALSLSSVDDDEASDDLLNNEIYGAAEDRPTGYEITDVEKDGDTVTVTVDLEGVEDGDDVELVLEADGRRAVLFRDWKVADGGLASEVTVSMPESSTTLEANGVALAGGAAGEDVDFWALPGSYTFNPHGDSKWLESGESRTVVPASESYGIYAELDDPQPSPELKEHVDSAIAEWVNDCMAVTELDPVDCPQNAYPSGDKQRKVAWTLGTMPTVSWDSFYGTFPVSLYSDSGEATLTYEYDASYGFGPVEWTEESENVGLYIGVQVDLVDDEPQVTFETD